MYVRTALCMLVLITDIPAGNVVVVHVRPALGGKLLRITLSIGSSVRAIYIHVVLNNGWLGVQGLL